MKRIPSVMVAAAASVALAVAAVTYAQPFGGMGPGFGPGIGMGMGPGHGRMAGIDHAAMVDSRLTEMKAQLKINTSQEAAWQTFASAAKQQAASMQALRAQMWESAGTAPEQMGRRTQAMQQRAAGMATMTDALSALYAVLTPEQKVIADQEFGMMGHRGMGYGRHAG